jgi:hypothetical protein
MRRSTKTNHLDNDACARSLLRIKQTLALAEATVFRSSLNWVERSFGSQPSKKCTKETGRFEAYTFKTYFTAKFR